eukprot:7554896-Pyramimonas_sp.AAC.1
MSCVAVLDLYIAASYSDNELAPVGSSRTTGTGPFQPPQRDDDCRPSLLRRSSAGQRWSS